jgi:hypothetical protein
LHAGDYLQWLGEAIGADELATEIAEIERDASLDAGASRARIKQAIARSYTAQA